MNSSKTINPRTLDFGSFDGHVWLNCAHQGPLPRVAVAAAQEALCQKEKPFLIKGEDFDAIPSRLKISLASLIGAVPEEIILGNSASYGLHVLRNGISWKSDDEVLAVRGDFPATVFPWLGLESYGVRTRLLTPRGFALSADELARELTPSTRLFCVSWVNSFNGSVIDLRGIGQLCRERGVLFVLNGSQGVGARPIDVTHEPVDALVSCGYKWLCGPYATGFCWMKPELLSQLKPAQSYWLPHAWGKENLADYELKDDIGSAAFDVFCTANFLNFVPWQASIKYLLSVGIAAIEEHNRALVTTFIENLDNAKYRLASPADPQYQSAIVAVSHVNQERNSEIHSRLVGKGIHAGLRNGILRFAPHLYNTAEEIGRTLETLNSLAAQ